MAERKVWTRDEIRELLRTNPKAVYRGIRVIHALQTESERATGTTSVSNGVGWSAYDAPIMTDLYNKLIQYGRFTNSQFELVRNKLMRYAAQLARVANKELEVNV